MEGTLEEKAKSGISTLGIATCIVCRHDYSLEERQSSEEYRILHKNIEERFGINPVDCCDNGCMMVGISLKANCEHINY